MAFELAIIRTRLACQALTKKVVPHGQAGVVMSKPCNRTTTPMPEELGDGQSIFLRVLQRAWSDVSRRCCDRETRPARSRIHTRAIRGVLRVYIGNTLFCEAFPATHVEGTRLIAHETTDTIFWVVLATIRKDGRDGVVIVEGKIPRSGCSSITHLLHTGLCDFCDMCSAIALLSCSVDRGEDVARSLKVLLETPRDSTRRTHETPAWYRHTADVRFFDNKGGRWVGEIVKGALNHAATSRRIGAAYKDGENAKSVSGMVAESKQLPGFLTRMRSVFNRRPAR